MVPAPSAPITVPTRPMATVSPFSCGLSPYSFTSASIAPAITTVSNPNSSPPRAPVSVAFIRLTFGRMETLPLEI